MNGQCDELGMKSGCIKTQAIGLLLLVVVSAVGLAMACGVGPSTVTLRVRIGASVAVFLLITSKTGVWGWSTPS